MIKQRFDLDVVPGAVPLIVHLKQYQTDVELQFDLFSRLGTLTIASTATECKIRGTKKDGNGYSANATYSDYSITVEVDEQMTAIAGMNPFELTLTDSTGKMITATFFLDVQRAALDADTVTSESLIREVEQVVEDYLEDNPGIFVVDPTLTQSGKAADAKKTGDEIADLKSALASKYINNAPITNPLIVAGAWNINSADSWNKRARTINLIKFTGKINISLSSYTKYKYSYVIYTKPDLSARTDSGWKTADSSNITVNGCGIGINVARLDGNTVMTASDWQEIQSMLSISGTGYLFNAITDIEDVSDYISYEISNNAIPFGKIVNGGWAANGYAYAGNRATIPKLIKFHGSFSISLSDYTKYQYAYVLYPNSDYSGRIDSGWKTADSGVLSFDGYGIAIVFAHVGGSGAIYYDELAEISDLLTINGTGTYYYDFDDLNEQVEDVSDYISYEISNNAIPFGKIVNGGWAANGYAYAGNRATIPKLIKFHGSFSISLSDYTKYQYAYVLYPNSDYSGRIDSGWKTADSGVLSFDGYGIAIVFAHVGGSGAVTIAELAEISELLSISGTGSYYYDFDDLNEQVEYNKDNPLLAVGSNICRTKLCYDHLFVTKEGNDIVIPAESIYHIRISKKFGFDMIEANVQKTSDGVFFVHHLLGGKFGNYFHHIDNSTDISDTSASSVTWEWITENVRYNSTIPKYRTRPCTLQEFLSECRQNELIPFVGTTDADAITIADSIMGVGNYVLYGTERRYNKQAILYHWVSNLTTKEDILNYCENVGKPFIFGLGNPNSFSNSEIKEIVELLHANGYMIGCSYADNQWYKYSQFGFDFNGTNKHINRIQDGNICNLNTIFDFDDFTYTGATLSNGVLIFSSSGGSFTPNIESKTYALCGVDLEIWIEGTINIPEFGEQNSSYNITSDGTTAVVCTTPIVNGNPKQTFWVSQGAIVKDIFFKASEF